MTCTIAWSIVYQVGGSITAGGLPALANAAGEEYFCSLHHRVCASEG